MRLVKVKHQHADDLTIIVEDFAVAAASPSPGEVVVKAEVSASLTQLDGLPITASVELA